MMFIGLVFLLFAFRVWFYGSNILTHGDWMYFFSETQREMLSLPNIWSSSGLGQMNLSITMYPISLLWGLATDLGFGISERLLYMIPSVLGAYFSIYLLLQYHFKNKYAVFIGSLLYTLNTYFMITRTGHLTLMVGYALAPLMLYSFHYYLDNKNARFLLSTILIGILIGYYESRVLYLLSLIIGLMGLYSCFITRTISIKKLVQFFSLFSGSIILANFYWILPFSMTHFFNNNQITDRALFGNVYMQIDRALTLFHPFWSGKEIIPFEIVSTPAYMWLIPLVAFVGLYTNRKNNVVIFYSLLALLGIFLAKQSNMPFSGVYAWLYNNFPGFSAFREASKFYFFIALGYSVMIAGCLEWLWQTKRRDITSNLLARRIIATVLAVIFLWNTKPILTGEIGTLFVPRAVPNDYVLLKNKIVENNDFFRTLWIPRASRWGFYSKNYPSISFADTELVCPSDNGCVEILGNQISNQILDAYSIKYVVVPIEDIENDDNFFVHYGHSREYYINELDKLEYLQRIDVSNGSLVVYENIKPNPHIYVSNSTNNYIAKHVPKSPAQYELILDKNAFGKNLHLTDSYHPDWKIRVGRLNWFQSLVQKYYFYPDKYHVKTDEGLNAWKMDSNWFSNQGISGDNIPITIYFAPQSWLNVGALVSLISVSLLLGLFITTLKTCEKKSS